MQQLFLVLLLSPCVVNSLPVANNVLSGYNARNFTPSISSNVIPLFKNGKNIHPDYYAIDPEAHMTITEMIRYHGYTVEVHKVETADGYELTIQRIPYGKKGPGKGRRKPVLVQHGVICSSASWVSNPPNKNLPYILADQGYDVWLGNIRGTLFGRKHKKYSPEQKEFWAYSFHEMAKYDVPAVIDMMLNKTGFDHIYYVGHSLGTVIAFTLLSTQPKYNDVIKGVFALAPVARMGEMRSPIRLIGPFIHEVSWVLNTLGTGELLANSQLMKLLASTVCNTKIKVFCENLIFVLCGYNPAQLNSTRLPVYLHHTPAATSVQNILHLGQLVMSNTFRQFDRGIVKNKQLYGQAIPPDYNLQNVKAPVALFWSDNDLVATPNDVSWLASQLPSLILKYRVPDASFSHLDFLWAIDVNELLYNKVVEVMNKLWRD